MQAAIPPYLARRAAHPTKTRLTLVARIPKNRGLDPRECQSLVAAFAAAAKSLLQGQQPTPPTDIRCDRVHCDPSTHSHGRLVAVYHLEPELLEKVLACVRESGWLGLPAPWAGGNVAIRVGQQDGYNARLLHAPIDWGTEDLEEAFVCAGLKLLRAHQPSTAYGFQLGTTWEVTLAAAPPDGADKIRFESQGQEVCQVILHPLTQLPPPWAPAAARKPPGQTPPAPAKPAGPRQGQPGMPQNTPAVAQGQSVEGEPPASVAQVAADGQGTAGEPAGGQVAAEGAVDTAEGSAEQTAGGQVAVQPMTDSQAAVEETAAAAAGAAGEAVGGQDAAEASAAAAGGQRAEQPVAASHGTAVTAATAGKDRRGGPPKKQPPKKKNTKTKQAAAKKAAASQKAAEAAAANHRVVQEMADAQAATQVGVGSDGTAPGLAPTGTAATTNAAPDPPPATPAVQPAQVAVTVPMPPAQPPPPPSAPPQTRVRSALPLGPREDPAPAAMVEEGVWETQRSPARRATTYLGAALTPPSSSSSDVPLRVRHNPPRQAKLKLGAFAVLASSSEDEDEGHPEDSGGLQSPPRV